MPGRLLKESLIVLGGTLFFLGLCATVGISTSTPPTSPTTEAAQADEHGADELDLGHRSVRRPEEVTPSSPADEPPSVPTYSGR